MEQPSDRDLMLALARGDREALSPLMERHHRRLYRLALSYLRDPDEALEGVQETFVKAYIAAPRWNDRSEVASWLPHGGINRGITLYRRSRGGRRRGEPLEEGPVTHDRRYSAPGAS